MQYTLKLAASELFKDKKLAYPPSVPRPFLTSHLCKSPLACMPWCLLHSIPPTAARADIRAKEASFNAKVPNIGKEKVINRVS